MAGLLRDLKNKHNVTVGLNLSNITSNTTTDGSAVDLQGDQGCTFIFYSGAVTDGTYTPVIEEDSTGSFAGAETAVADADLIGTEAAAAISAANTVTTIGYRGSVRYVRPTVVSASTTTGGNIGCLVLTLKDQTS